MDDNVDMMLSSIVLPKSRKHPKHVNANINVLNAIAVNFYEDYTYTIFTM